MSGPARYTWEAAQAELRKLAEHIPEGQLLELTVFGGVTVQHWEMPGRLTRDIDVQQSRCSDNFESLAKVLDRWVRFRNTEAEEPGFPYIEVAGPEQDPYLPRFSMVETVEIAPNLKLNFPSPAEIAASKLAYADNIGRVQDLADIEFLRGKFALTAEQILPKVLGIAGETLRRRAVQNLQRLDQLIAQIPERKAQLIEHSRQRAARYGQNLGTGERRYPGRDDPPLAPDR
jgi:hypothetical protein